MNQYDNDPTDANWEQVKTAFVDGWAAAVRCRQRLSVYHTAKPTILMKRAGFRPSLLASTHGKHERQKRHGGRASVKSISMGVMRIEA